MGNSPKYIDCLDCLLRLTVISFFEVECLSLMCCLNQLQGLLYHTQKGKVQHKGHSTNISFGEFTFCTTEDVLSLGTVLLVLPSDDQALRTSWLEIMPVHSGEGVYESLDKIEPPFNFRYHTSRRGNSNLSQCHNFLGIQQNVMDSFYMFYNVSNYQNFHINPVNHICPLCEDCEKQCSYQMKGLDIYLMIHNFPFC